jgi:hypothetical protein
MLTLLGDVVICPAVAARNAVEHEVSLDDEVALLVVHGLLHLLGMDHEDDAEAERMEALEQELLTRFYRTRCRGVDRHRASTPRTPSSSSSSPSCSPPRACWPWPRPAWCA